MAFQLSKTAEKRTNLVTLLLNVRIKVNKWVSYSEQGDLAHTEDRPNDSG